ncbi:MAG: response regulator [Planctomycetaceae bacterium]
MPADSFSPTLESAGRAAGLSRLRLLCVSPREPAWTNLALQLDAAGCHDPSFRWVATSGEALAALRKESFDCVLIDAGDSVRRMEEPLLEALHTGGQSAPVILLTSRADDRLLAEACENGCDVLPADHPWESRALVPMIRRAIARGELLRENHRLTVAQHRRLVHERDEAEHLLRQQREIIQELNGLMHADEAGVPADGANPPAADPPEVEVSPPADAAGSSRLPAEFHGYYHELLRTYVMMGSGNLGAEIGRVAELLALAGLSPREALESHLARVESLVRGLGNRSTRHVMARADLLALELMIHLGECYQRQSRGPRPVEDSSFGGLAETARRLRDATRELHRHSTLKAS